MDLTDNHYEKLLGLGGDWKVIEVDLDIGKLRVDVHIEYLGDTLPCPECGAACGIYDHSPERMWRHLDTMQFLTMLHCATPRVECSKHGVKTVAVPWAGKHARFTLLFEAFAIKVIEASRTLQDARGLLGLNWHQVQNIMKRAVDRGIERREKQEIAWIGMDEKSFRRGHRYISLINDVDGGRVLDVAEGRTSEVAEGLIVKALEEDQRQMVCGVAIDMSAPYEKAIRKMFPHADIVHDKFHISQHLNKAVDKTRAREHRQMMKGKDDRLKGTKYLWLMGMEHLDTDELAKVNALKASGMNVAKAWYVKEVFRHFWSRRDAGYARSYFDYWYQEAANTKLPDVIAVAKMLKRHLSNILTYFDCYITNAVSEGLNSKIQAIKANARGFRNFENYRTSIMFFCGKLELYP